MGDLEELRRATKMVGDGEELTPQEVADLLGVSPATVRRWEEREILHPARRLPGSGHRRYRRSDVLALQEQMTAENAPPADED